MSPDFDSMLRGGHPNSLGRTVEAVELVLADPSLLGALIDTYASDDATVRLRVSSALNRISRARPELLAAVIDRLLVEPGEIDQPSAQWTFARLVSALTDDLTGSQRRRALEIMKRNLDRSDDWIVQNTTMQALADWAGEDPELGAWLEPRLLRFLESPRKSVAGRAKKLLDLGAES